MWEYTMKDASSLARKMLLGMVSLTIAQAWFYYKPFCLCIIGVNLYHLNTYMFHFWKQFFARVQAITLHILVHYISSIVLKLLGVKQLTTNLNCAIYTSAHPLSIT